MTATKSMPKAFREALDNASFSIDPARVLEAQALLFTSCKWMPPTAYRRTNGTVYYLGKLNTSDARCIVWQPYHQSPQGIRARTLGYRCADKPAEPKLYSRSKNHRGQYGLLEGDAKSWIEHGYEAV